MRTWHEDDLKKAIDNIFDFLESTDYGYSAWKQDIEAKFWDRFFGYLKNMQKTERNRILTQMADTGVEKVEIEFEKLLLISEYYEFPVAVFFMPIEELRKIRKEGRTRMKDIQKKLEKLEKIREIVDEEG